MKAGTTFLFNIASKHPDLFFTPEKEIHFLAHMYGLDYRSMKSICQPAALLKRDNYAQPLHDVLSMDFRRRRLAAVMRGRFARLTNPQDVRDAVLWYADCYLIPEVDWAWVEKIYMAAEPEQWLCEFSNYNAFASPNAWAAVRDKFDEIKVVYVVRDPLDRLWSHIKFDRRYSPEEFTEGATLSNRTLKRFLEDPHICSYGDYKTVLGNLTAEIGTENILVIDFDELVNSPQQICSALESFLDIGEFPANALKNLRPANVGLGHAAPLFLAEAAKDFIDEQRSFMSSVSNSR